MSKKTTSKRIITILAAAVLPILLIQSLALAAPTSPPPGGNIAANFDDLTVGNINMINDSIYQDLTIGEEWNFGFGGLDTYVSIANSTNNSGLFLSRGINNFALMHYTQPSDTLNFYTRSGSTFNTNHLVLNPSSGNVGIGTDEPFARLQLGVPTEGDYVYGSAHPSSLAIAGNATDTEPSIWLGTDTTHKAEITYDGTSSNLYIENNSTTDHPAQLTLADNGNIGMNAGPNIVSSALEVQAYNPTSVSQIILGKYDTNNYGILGKSSVGVLGRGSQYGVRGEYNSSNYGILGSNSIGVSGVGTLYALKGTYDANNYGAIGSSNTGVKAVGSSYGIDATGGSTGVKTQGESYGIYTQAIQDTESTGASMGIFSQVQRNNINGTYYSGFFVDDNSSYGRLGNYHGLFADKIEVERGANDDIDGYIASFTNTNNAYGGDGVAINLGTAVQGTPAHMIDFNHYDGTEIGSITKLAGTVTYNAFTGGHMTKTPNNSTYEYGTIMSLKEVTSEEGSQQPQYFSEPTSSVYDNHIFGVYASIYSEEENTHQVYAVGDGHVLVTTENGSIKAGDPITSSNLAGLGMKATEAGTILGYALEDWDGSETSRTETLADGTEVKVALVAVYYYPGTFYAGNQQDQIDALKQEIDELKNLLQ